MSLKVMTAVWEAAEIDGTLLILLLALADNANDAGVCWPSVATLSRKIRRSRARTFELLADAETRGLLTRERGFGGRTNHYRLLLGQGPALRTVQPSGRSDAPDGQGPALRTGRVQPSGHRTVSEPSVNRKFSPAREESIGLTPIEELLHRLMAPRAPTLPQLRATENDWAHELGEATVVRILTEVVESGPHAAPYAVLKDRLTAAKPARPRPVPSNGVRPRGFSYDQAAAARSAT